MRILVVEDDLTTREMMAGMLSEYGEIETAENGKEGVDSFCSAVEKKQPYDLICLDILMPEMDGQEALKLIREKEKSLGVSMEEEVKIIMTTTVDTADEVSKAYYMGGCTSYLIKPVEKKKLTGLMNQFKLI